MGDGGTRVTKYFITPTFRATRTNRRSRPNYGISQPMSEIQTQLCYPRIFPASFNCPHARPHHRGIFMPISSNPRSKRQS